MKTAAIKKVLGAYIAARWRAARLRDREAIEAYQGRRLARIADHATRSFDFYKPFAGRDFAALPIVDKQVLLDNFAAMNRSRLPLDIVRAALDRGEGRVGNALIGMSTGTSGNRGYYVIEESERFTWLGTILAKALPDALWRRHRVALALPAMSDLYGSARLGSRIDLRFFHLALGPDAWADELAAFDPDTIVAPPKVLRWLAERGQLRAINVLSGAEVLDPLDREIIERATGRRMRELYMATEGLFGVGCEHGTLHLAEDVVHFEFDRPDTGGVLVSPIVTDFTRREQAMIRYRMNDLIELDPEPCPCGLAYHAVKRIEGRRDDCFYLPDAGGELRLVTPDILRNTLVDADRAIDDFRIVQSGANQLVLSLPARLEGEVPEKAKAALVARLAQRGLHPEITMSSRIEVDFSRKLRRVRREWTPPAQP